MDRANFLLDRLGAAERARLHPRLEEVTLHYKEELLAFGKPIDYVYFPTVGVVSMVTDLAHGATVETGTVGREGMVGISALLGGSVSTSRAFAQIPGYAYRLSAAALQDHLRHPGGELAVQGLRYANTLVATISQTAACNRAHTVEERMARWLLLSRDRVDSDAFPLTQEFLSEMLGVRRPTVSLTGATLQKAGLIRYTRGQITVLDRQGLEAVSCECYQVIRELFEKRSDAAAHLHANQ